MNTREQFVLTPELATQYKTAYFTQESHRKNAASGLPQFPKRELPTDAVRIRYDKHRWSAEFKCDEAVFAVYRTMEDRSLIGYYYERSLERFCL